MLVLSFYGCTGDPYGNLNSTTNITAILNDSESDAALMNALSLVRMLRLLKLLKLVKCARRPRPAWNPAPEPSPETHPHRMRVPLRAHR